MSNDPYQHRSFWTDPNICLEKDKDGKCLVSAKYIFLTLNEEQKQELFCQKIKLNNYDKTI